MEPKDVEKPNLPDIPAIKPQELPAKRRIAHESKDAEVLQYTCSPIHVLCKALGKVVGSSKYVMHFYGVEPPCPLSPLVFHLISPTMTGPRPHICTKDEVICRF